MEQHPVPQNVTTFQFRLIGDMTIKQFGFLAGGAILAYISYKLPLPFFFTWPLAALFGLGGVGFAFVPIEDRPMDVWVLSFFKSAYRPTQYLWMLNTPTPSPASPAEVPTFVGTKEGPWPPMPIPKQVSPTNSAVVKHQDPVIAAPPTTLPTSPAVVPLSGTKAGSPTPAPTPPSPAVVPTYVGTKAGPPRHNGSEAEVARLTEQLNSMQKEMQTKSLTEARVVELQKQLTDLLNEKSQMENELISLKKHSTLIPTSAPKVGAPQSANPAKTINVISQDRTAGAGLPRFTSHPNIITGIVKDTDNNLLPGVLVTVRDTKDVPLRALKTNKLGQFAASTPLSNGIYLVEIEDPRNRYVFDRAQLTLNGSVVPTIEIIAKNAKVLAREQLNKELFGNPAT